MAELRKSHSNYILRRKRQLTSKGALYERDWMTVSELDGFAPGTLPVYASGNFKMTVNNDRGGKKKYSFSNWLLNDEGDENWTINSLKDEEFTIKSTLVKPNYSSILDFAYYGSAVELVHGSINDIIGKFPGELYTTNNSLTYASKGKYETLDRVVENPFSIDLFSPYVNEDSVDNPLRYMAISWDKYEVINEDGQVCDVIGWDPGTPNGKPCFNGDKVFIGAKIMFDDACCEGGGSTGSTDYKTGRKINDTTLTIPMGNGSQRYFPALQTVYKDIYEYNSPFDPVQPENVTGWRDGDTVYIPMGNRNGGQYRYYPELQKITRGVYEYNVSGGVEDNTELTPVPSVLPPTELTPRPMEGCNVITFDGVFVNGYIYLTSDKPGYHIRPKEQYIEEWFSKFDDFESVLLNRESKPKYKAKFFTPRETDRGVITHEVAYVWPVLQGGWNLDFLSGAYESYLEGLMYLATYYDECRSDNIWRSYTHESIKNFDWTTPTDTYVPEIDGHEIDVERVEAILKVCGRQFDDLKRYIENIRFTVNMSYDSKNNMPDKNMAKFLEMNGWDVKNVSPMNDESFKHVEEYPGKSVKTTPEGANLEFIKRMILNSRNILSKKGTRAGIDAVYSMFGIFDMKHGEKIRYNGQDKTVGYTIDEFVNFTKNYIRDDEDDDNDNFSKIIDLNSEKSNYQSEYERTWDDLCGLMVGRISYDGVQYLVPWYDMGDAYDGNPYYQMFGGWGHRQRKTVKVDFSQDFTIKKELVSDTGCTPEFSIYDETVKNVKVVESFKVLNQTPIGFLEEGDVYYVLNLSEAYNLYNCDEEDDSHYVFFTGNTDYDRTVPYNDDHSWCLVRNSDFTASPLPWYAKKILYLESIHDVSAGNNPHNGNAGYDSGSEYFKYYKEIFKGAIENGLFDEYRERVQSENARRHYDNRFRTTKLNDLPDKTVGAELLGFDVETCVDNFTKDNDKIWYFLSSDSGIYTRNDVQRKKVAPNYFINHRKETGSTSYTKETMADFPLEYPGKTFQNKPISDTASTITTSASSLDVPSTIRQMSGGYGPDELWGYSVINTKNMRITYHLPREMEDYVTNVVEFYVKQMIPSTVILDIKWEYV